MHDEYLVVGCASRRMPSSLLPAAVANPSQTFALYALLSSVGYCVLLFDCCIQYRPRPARWPRRCAYTLGAAGEHRCLKGFPNGARRVSSYRLPKPSRWRLPSCDRVLDRLNREFESGNGTNHVLRWKLLLGRGALRERYGVTSLRQLFSWWVLCITQAIRSELPYNLTWYWPSEAAAVYVLMGWWLTYTVSTVLSLANCAWDMQLRKEVAKITYKHQ